MIPFSGIKSNFEASLELANISFENAKIGLIPKTSCRTKHTSKPKDDIWFERFLEKINAQEFSSKSIPEIPLYKVKKEDILRIQTGKINNTQVKLVIHISIEQIGTKPFIEHLVESFLNQIFKTKNQKLELFPDDVGRIAGKALLKKELGCDFNKAQSLFIELCRIAILPYEGSHTLGVVIFSQAQQDSIEEIIRIERTIPFSKIKGIRKMLEVGKGELLLLATKDGVYGLGKEKQEKEENSKIVFLSNGAWLLCKGKRILYQVYAGITMLYEPKLSQLRLQKALDTIFPKLQLNQGQHLFELISSVVNQPNGTNILIDENAAQVVVHLKPQCTAITPKKLDKKLIQLISRIDGTVIMDQRGICFGFGAILDGKVAKEGDSARGGRFNSAMMYCEHNKSSCLIIVVSQDGTVDLVFSS